MNWIAFSWSFMKLLTKMISSEIRTAYSCHGVTFKNANVSKKIYPIRESIKRSVSAFLVNFHQVGGTNKQERWFDLICKHEQTSPVLTSKSKCKTYLFTCITKYFFWHGNHVIFTCESNILTLSLYSHFTTQTPLVN